MQEHATLESRLQHVKDAVRKATAEAMKSASSEDPLFVVAAAVPSQSPTNAAVDDSNVEENTDPNASSKASFHLGMTLFGQEIHVVERQIRDKLDGVEKELGDLVVTLEKQNTMVSEHDDDEEMDEGPRNNGANREESLESLSQEAQELQTKIHFLKECSLARSLLDEASIVSSSGTAHDPDWVEAARLLAKAQTSLESAQQIVDAEEDRSSSDESSQPALVGAHRILDSIRLPTRRTRIELLSKATDLLDENLIVTEDSIAVRGARLGSRPDGIHAAYDILGALAPDDYSHWNNAVRRFTDRLFQVVLQPPLQAHKMGNPLSTPWKFQEISDVASKGLSGRIAVTSSKRKGPTHTLEWTRDTEPSTSSLQAIQEEDETASAWGETFAFVQRIMSFVEERVLLQREPLCQYVGKRLFGTQSPRSINTIDLAAFGLESDLLGDDRGSFMKPTLQLLAKTCIPSYLPTNELGRLRTQSEKLASSVDSLESTLVTKNFLSKIEGMNLPLSDFALNLERKYVDKRRVTILNEGRLLMVETDYHNTVEVGVDVSDRKDKLLGEDDGMAVFELHKSSISQTASKLLDLCRRSMDEAVATATQDPSSPLARLPASLYRGAREILDLFRAVIPSILGEEVANVPRTAAMLYNDCVFFAHHCLTLGLEYKEKFPPVSSEEDTRGKVLRQTCIFVDMVPPFRELAQKSMGDMLERQQGQLWEVVGMRITLLGESLRSNELVSEWTEAETALKAGLYHVRHLSQAWRPILSNDVYVRSIAHLADVIFTMFIDQVLKASAISVPAGHVVGALFGDATRGMSDLLKEEVVVCRTWDRFNAIARFMDMSLADINVGLSEGVFRSVTAAELSRLIMISFDESNKREALLQLLAAEK